MQQFNESWITHVKRFIFNEQHNPCRKSLDCRLVNTAIIKNGPLTIDFRKLHGPHCSCKKKYSKTYKVFSDQREIDFLVMLSHIHKIQRGCRELFWERPWQSWPYLCTEGPATFRVHTDGSTPGISNKHGHVEHRILDLPLYRRPPGSPWSDEKWDVTRVLEFPGYTKIYARKHL